MLTNETQNKTMCRYRADIPASYNKENTPVLIRFKKDESDVLKVQGRWIFITLIRDSNNLAFSLTQTLVFLRMRSKAENIDRSHSPGPLPVFLIGNVLKSSVNS